jgi:hypothetical protein
LPKFFSLTTQRDEDKVVNKMQRIYADSMTIDLATATTPVTLITTSYAPFQKIKFFVDSYTAANGNTYYAGQWVELEHAQAAVVANVNGFIELVYTIAKQTGIGSYQFSISSPNVQTGTLYITSVTFEDSFYNPANAPITPDKVPLYQRNLAQEIDNLPLVKKAYKLTSTITTVTVDDNIQFRLSGTSSSNIILGCVNRGTVDLYLSDFNFSYLDGVTSNNTQTTNYQVSMPANNGVVNIVSPLSRPTAPNVNYYRGIIFVSDTMGIPTDTNYSKLINYELFILPQTNTMYLTLI